MHIAWCCLEEVPYCFSRSSVKFQGHTALKIVKFDPNWPFPDSNIQIKIYAEYRDMLPRPRLVCQEPGLRQIGRSPGVPDKSRRGLGSMSRYSAQILICFIAYIFLIFFIPLWVWLGTLQDCQYAQCPLPWMNEAGHQTIKAPSMPCWGEADPIKTLSEI